MPARGSTAPVPQPTKASICGNSCGGGGGCTNGPNATGNYFGTAKDNYAPSNLGTEAWILVNNATVTDNGKVNHVLWEGTNNDPHGGSWVEAGARVYSNSNILGLYWADVRPGYNYSAHAIPVAAVNGQYYDFQILYTAANTWTVYVGGQNVGHSYPNPGYSQYMASGLESTSANNHADGSYSAFLDYAQMNGNWTSQWASNTIEYCNFPAIAYWSTPLVTLYNSE